MTEEPRPYVPADTTLPELTIKVLVLGVVLAVVLAGANAYLGLFAGLTVSALHPSRRHLDGGAPVVPSVEHP